MKRIKLIFPALLVMTMGLFAGGCVVHGRAGMHANAHVAAPELVYVGPEVQVVQDYHEPVFYSDGYYWRYYDGVWFRSQVHYGSWVRVRTVPVAVRSVDRPHTYVRYRGNARVRTYDNRPARVHHRSNHDSRPAPPPRAYGPSVREHRSQGHGRPTTVHVREHRGNGNAHGHVRGNGNVNGNVRVKVKANGNDRDRDRDGNKTIRVRER